MAWSRTRFLLPLLAALPLLPACSLLGYGPLCAHPSCLAHLELGAVEEEVLAGTWGDATWERGLFYGPVGRDLTILRCYSSISPLAFEDGELMGWSHRFDARSVAQGGPLRLLEGLESGVGPTEVRKVMGKPDRVARFRADDGEEIEIWSWIDVEVALCLSRHHEFDPLTGEDTLEPELVLRGYVEGFEDFRAER